MKKDSQLLFTGTSSVFVIVVANDPFLGYPLYILLLNDQLHLLKKGNNNTYLLRRFFKLLFLTEHRLVLIPLALMVARGLL